jgi:hypothetical protein
MDERMEAVNTIFFPQGCERAKKNWNTGFISDPNKLLQYFHISSTLVAMYNHIILSF